MNPPSVARDERTLLVENASYRWSYLFVSFGLLADVAWRSAARQESSWDLLALVILSGVLTTAYQGIHRVLTRRWAMVAGLTVLLAAVLAAAIAFVR
jgi:tryptophan-rich sensory protein